MFNTENRWLIVVAAVIMMISLGVIYAWGPIKNELKVMGWSDTQAALPFSIALASDAFMMILAGLWQDRVGPRKVAVTGALLYSVGFIMSSFRIEPLWLNFWYGIVAGAGIGIAYVCPLAALVKWFPDKKGTISGIVVAGFGSGAFFFAQIIPQLIDSAPPEMNGIAYVMRSFGILFLFVTTLSALILRNPPKNYTPPGWEPKHSNDTPHVADYEFSAKEMLKTQQFWIMWIIYLAGVTAGIMSIGHIATYAKDMLTLSGIVNIAAKAAAIVGVLSLFNGAGRLFWGWASDKIGRSYALFLILGFLGLSMFLVTKMTTYTTIMAIAAFIGFNFGGTLATFPSITADYFGTTNFGLNYGLLISAYGFGSLIGPLLGGYIYDTSGNYNLAFTIVGTTCFLAALLAFALKQPKAPLSSVGDN